MRPEPWGWWQAVHSSAAGPWTTAAPAFLAGSWWQLTHRARASAFSSFGRSDWCPRWQLVQSAAALWGWLPARALATSSWHVPQRVAGAFARTGAKSPVCASWQVRHSPSAAGGCRLPFPAAGFSWQVRHTAEPPAGAFIGAVFSWQLPQSGTGCTEALSSFSLAAEWGGWQEAHAAPFTENPPWAAAKPSLPSWQEAQSSSRGCFRRRGVAEPCAWWQVRQPSAAGAWTTFPWKPAPEWHFVQSSRSGLRSIFGRSEPWGSWQVEHLPTSGWRCSAFVPMRCASWQPRQSCGSSDWRRRAPTRPWGRWQAVQSPLAMGACATFRFFPTSAWHSVQVPPFSNRAPFRSWPWATPAPSPSAARSAERPIQDLSRIFAPALTEAPEAPSGRRGAPSPPPARR